MEKAKFEITSKNYMHHCEAALITCEDFRLHQRKNGQNCITDFIKNIGVECDLITRAGGVQDLIRPKEGFGHSILRDAEVSVKLHNASRIFLVNHEDCGAYSSFSFASKEAEFEWHKEDLIAGREILKKEFLVKEVRIYFARLVKNSKDLFEIREIDL